MTEPLAPIETPDNNGKPERCGVVAVVGAPNAGKSTIVNALVGQKIAITSPKAQTTRTRVMGVGIEEETQIVLVDTPGIFSPGRRLDRAMVAAAWGGAQDADIIALIIDGRGGLGPKMEPIIEGLAKRSEPLWLILNKVDVADKGKLLILTEKLHALIKPEETYYVSALTGDGLPELKRAMANAMPEGPWHFPADQVSNATDRLFTAEITREQLYHQLNDELPYKSAVETEQYKERQDGSIEIHQQILVERASQRAIVLGKGGQRLKEIGSRSRAELIKLLGVPVHLYLHVKVKENWDDDRAVYRDIGLDWVE
ncbi:GTPase Era [Sphingobium sufflavum]|uniref:GTPase Era n=1 Tax=Sphingobium sufflavum TaxID=1129547 RepID=UPI001F342356|nr:GTPase Era [Sphingobium sufflavum]MCE7797005.1 GTPase Era [Sphingobium sufflavum]